VSISQIILTQETEVLILTQETEVLIVTQETEVLVVRNLSQSHSHVESPGTEQGPSQ
jgi:hypothetical protein